MDTTTPMQFRNSDKWKKFYGAVSHSQIISLHGFYFELTSIRQNGICTCYLKRLRPSNSVLSFRICERQTFSMRQDREVRYCVKIQWKTVHRYQMENLAPITQIFMFGEETSEGQVLRTKTPNTDLFVSYSLLFPPS